LPVASGAVAVQFVPIDSIPVFFSDQCKIQQASEVDGRRPGFVVYSMVRKVVGDHRRRRAQTNPYATKNAGCAFRQYPVQGKNGIVAILLDASVQLNGEPGSLIVQDWQMPMIFLPGGGGLLVADAKEGVHRRPGEFGIDEQICITNQPRAGWIKPVDKMRHSLQEKGLYTNGIQGSDGWHQRVKYSPFPAQIQGSDGFEVFLYIFRQRLLLQAPRNRGRDQLQVGNFDEGLPIYFGQRVRLLFQKLKLENFTKSQKGLPMDHVGAQMDAKVDLS
jgi:hypothetical protein